MSAILGLLVSVSLYICICTHLPQCYAWPYTMLRLIGQCTMNNFYMPQPCVLHNSAIHCNTMLHWCLYGIVINEQHVLIYDIMAFLKCWCVPHVGKIRMSVPIRRVPREVREMFLLFLISPNAYHRMWYVSLCGHLPCLQVWKPFVYQHGSSPSCSWTQ